MLSVSRIRQLLGFEDVKYFDYFAIGFEGFKYFEKSNSEIELLAVSPSSSQNTCPS